MSALNIVQELRSRLTDSRSQVRAFGISVQDRDAASAVLDVRNGRFDVTVIGGTAPSLSLDLSLPKYDTVGKLVRAIASVNPWYAAQQDEDMDEEFPSISISDLGPLDILGQSASILHRKFSDAMLTDVLRRAVLRHNPSMSLDIVPDGEAELVITLAHSMLMKQMATGAVKYRGMGMTVSEALAVADSLEKSYRADMVRLARAIQSPREAAPNIMREGDIVVGKFSRRMRNGRMQSAGNIPPEQPVLIEPDALAIEDTHVYLTWQRSADASFNRYELWRDTSPYVAKDRGTSVKVTSCPPGVWDPVRDTLARNDGSFGGLEPETTYFFRLYVVDANGEYTGSQVVQATTLALRSKLLATTPPTPSTVQAGDVITMTFDPAYTAPASDLRVSLGDKNLIPTITGAYEATITVPVFFQKGAKDLRVISPNGLMDVYKSITVT